jgi:hypothetical protein
MLVFVSASLIGLIESLHAMIAPTDAVADFGEVLIVSHL